MSVRTQKTLLIILLVLVVAAFCILAAVPPVSRDALTHHLLVPKLYLTNGGIYEIPQIPFSYYPQNLDLLYMAGMYFFNDIVPTYIHMFFGLLTAVLIFGYLRKRYTAVWGLLGSLFFLTIPVIIKLSITTYVDFGVIFFAFASLLALLKWRDANARPGWLILAGVMCGLCMGSKYNGVVDFCILTAFVPVLYAGMKRTQFLEKYPTLKPKLRLNDNLKAILYGIIFAIIAVVVFSPWAIKNYIWTDNPIYPLAQGIFNADQGGTEKDLYGMQGEGYGLSPRERREALYGETFVQTLLVPLRVFFEGEDNNPQFYDGRLNSGLLIFSIVGLLFIRRREAKFQAHDLAFICYAAIMVLLIFFLIEMRIRYISTIIAPMVILAVVGMRSLLVFITKRQMASQKLFNIAVKLIIALSFVGNFVYLGEKFVEVEPFSYISGKVTRDEYITLRRPEYPVIQYLNANVPKGEGIYAIFLGNRMYYSDHLLTMDYAAFFKYIERADSAHELADDLEKAGYRYFLFNADLMNEFAPDFLNVEGLQRLDTFTSLYCERLVKANNHIVFKLRPGAQRAEITAALEKAGYDGE